mgnify:CR=1 FL=1
MEAICMGLGANIVRRRKTIKNWCDIVVVFKRHHAVYRLFNKRSRQDSISIGAELSEIVLFGNWIVPGASNAIDHMAHVRSVVQKNGDVCARFFGIQMSRRVNAVSHFIRQRLNSRVLQRVSTRRILVHFPDDEGLRKRVLQADASVPWGQGSQFLGDGFAKGCNRALGYFTTDLGDSGSVNIEC